MENLVYVGFGSNLEDKVSNCLDAFDYLGSSWDNKLSRISSLYQTEPVGFKDQDWFVNGVAEVLTRLSPMNFLDLLLGIEKRMGRKRIIHWGPRIIDLDILLFNDDIIREEKLIVPHPYMHERRFVLEPFAEIAPDKIHPVLGKTISDLLKDLPRNAGGAKKILGKVDETDCICKYLG